VGEEKERARDGGYVGSWALPCLCVCAFVKGGVEKRQSECQLVFKHKLA
jgi:hypothetical protein